jgi:hypothetical protein
MGCVHSGLNVWHAKYGSPYDFFTELLPYKATFEALHLTETDIGKFYLLFLEIDVDGSMSVDLSEVFNHLRIEKTYFNRRVFGLLDVDNSGSLNFKEFVVGLWNYCTLTDALFGTIFHIKFCENYCETLLYLYCVLVIIIFLPILIIFCLLL